MIMYEQSQSQKRNFGIKNSKDIIEAVFNDDNEMNNAAPVPMSSEIRNMIKNMRYSGTLPKKEAAVAERYRYRIVACLVTSSRPVPLKTCRVWQRCTLNLSRAETSSQWCGVVVRRRGARSGVVHVT
ncbi:uncharacterized protein TNCV_1438201 [Trichonephila clavipes]|nr:uncharacterized protein TNCV_1438201 [Trichonephila clavipes]